MIPKIVFKEIPLKLEVEMFSAFLDREHSSRILPKYPQFSTIAEPRLQTIETELIRIRKDRAEEIKTKSLEIEKNWRMIEQNIFETLSEIIQEEWPEREVTAYVSVNPVCPRFLDSWSFSVTFDSKCSNMIITHEISHFLYFKKLKKEFPEITRRNYESPHKEWILSEIIATIILNDPRIKNIIGQNAGYYEKHKAIMIDGKPLTGLIENLYQELVVGKHDFTGFIKEGLRVINLIK